MSGPRFLIVDDKQDLAHGVALVLGELSSEIGVVHSAEEALRDLDRVPADLVFSDIRMPRMDGIALLKAIRERWPRTHVILFTAFGSIDSAVEAMRLGAFHYLTKPFNGDELLVVAQRALEERRAKDELARLRAELEDRHSFHGIWGRDPQMLAVFDAIRRVSAANAAILVSGESGTGKELVARAIHADSARSGKSFVAFNAAALPEALAEAELFGARKGAYTGADRDRPGLFVEADGGTLFIDELASMALPLQGKLLRVLQEGEVLALGSTRPVPVDVRVISASNVDPLRLVRDGRLRRDLYYRLAVLKIALPPLRERVEDIPLLASHFLARRTQSGGQQPKVFSPAAIRRLMAYQWPGNVRELQNVIERAFVLSTGDTIGPEEVHLEDETDEAGGGWEAGLPYEEARARVLSSFQRRYVERVLARSDRNIAAAARMAGLTRAAFYRMLKRLGITSPAELNDPGPKAG